MIKKITWTLFLISPLIHAQVGINIDTNVPSATLDIVSKENTTDKIALQIKNHDGKDVLRVLDNANTGVANVPKARMDIRNLVSATNPGEGYIGIGTTSFTAPSAGAGAIRYNEVDKRLEYSNGIYWYIFQPVATKSLVVASKSFSTNSIANNASVTVNSWEESVDINSDFDASTGVFTVPRNGVYLVSATLGFRARTDYKGWLEAIIIVKNSAGVVQAKYFNSSPADGGGSWITPGSSITLSVPLLQGQTVELQAANYTGINTTLRYDSGSDPDSKGFNNLCISEK